MSDVRLAGFELIEKIGEGGMGQVWKARQLSLDRIVAIKLLPSRFSHDPESVRQMMKEARTAAKLKHSGIVQVYDASECNGNYYFVMEYVDGYTVGQWVTRKKALPVKDALVVVESVAAALDYAWHTSGLIHCDLKPENIMVDHDGTIKVADLGLSLTQDSQVTQQSEEVAGTPGYISPEQVMGEEQLDCRTDIYALGCCLYQMVTGARPFAGLKDSEAMEAQVSSQISDPRDLVPDLPGPVCALIERMMVKDRDDRLRDWSAVLADVHRVSKGLMPSGHQPAEGASTVKGRHIPAHLFAGDADRNQSDTTGPRKGVSAGLILVALVFAATGIWLALRKPMPRPDVILPPTPVVSVSPKSVGGSGIPLGPHHSAPPAPAVRKNMTHAEQVAAAQAEIARVTDAFVSGGRIGDAVEWLDHYSGACATDTATNRAALIVSLRSRMAALEADLRIERDWQSLLNQVGGLVMAGKFTDALHCMEPSSKMDQMGKHRGEWVAMTGVLNELGSLNDRVLATFTKDIGKVITIRLSRGELVGTVVEVRDRKVLCATADGAAQVDIHLEDMSSSERAARLASLDLPGAYLARGVAAFNDRKMNEAGELFAKAGPVLGPLLAGRVRAEIDAQTRAAMDSDVALVAFSGLMKRAGIEPGLYDPDSWRKAIDACRMSRSQASELDRAMDDFLRTHGESSFAARNPDLILALQSACGKAQEGQSARGVPPPPSTPPAHPVAGSPLGEIASALMARNPGLEFVSVKYDESAMDEGMALRIKSKAIRDLSPLANFKAIKSLELDSGDRSTVALDITPLTGLSLNRLVMRGYIIESVGKLRGMRLRRLVIPGTPLKSLAVLSGMPLVELDISGSEVTDLTGLQGLKLERLSVADTKVASIMPLRGVSIRELNLHGTPVRDVTYLQGVPVERLDVSNTLIFDFSVLSGFKCTSLNVGGTTVRDLGFCSGMPLTELNIDGTTVGSLYSLRGKTLKRLILGNSVIRDMSALKSITLSSLDLSGSKIAPGVLGPALSQARFEELNLSGTMLERIDFLRGHEELRVLNLSHSRVADLTPILEVPVEVLNIKGTPMEDVAILHSLRSLRRLETDIETERLRPLLRALPDLQTVNGVAASVLLEQQWPPPVRPDREGPRGPFRKPRL